MVTESKFPPGALVRDNHAKVGRVVGDPIVIELDGNPVEVFAVDFWGQEIKRPDSFLTLLPPDNAEALLVERPEALSSWADEAPLRLVALALSTSGGEGKMADIRAKLDGRVLEAGKWENWWKKQQQQMRKLPTCFKIVKTGRDSEYELLAWYESVPTASQLKTVGSPKKQATTSADWRAWLEAGTHHPPPGRFPTSQAASLLARWPADTIEQALLRVIVSAEEALASGELPAQAAEGWLRAVAQASLRRREVGGTDTRGYTAARAGHVLARLARIPGDRAPQDLVLSAGALDGGTEAWRRGFLAGMWDAFDGDDARQWYLASSTVLGRQARGDLARELFAAAFGPDLSDRRHSGLDRLLDALPEVDRDLLLREAVASASADQRENVLGYLAGSRHAEGPDRQDLRLLAALTLGRTGDELVTRVSRELSDVVVQPEKYGRQVQAVFSAAVGRQEQGALQAEAEVRKGRETIEEQLEQERREQERLRQQVRERNAELAANREKSRLELRQDMLLAVGEVLQSVARRTGDDGLHGDIGAGLALALRAGGAEPLGSPGEVVPFDPERHTADAAVRPSSAVRVIAPGVIYIGRIHGDRVLLKAQVKHEAG